MPLRRAIAAEGTAGARLNQRDDGNRPKECVTGRDASGAPSYGF